MLGPPRGVTIDQDRLARLRAVKMPKFDEPLHFDPPEADAILSALEVFPPDNPWNIPVDEWPIAANSKAMIVAIGENKPLRYNPDMSFVLVPPNQKKVAMKLTAYAGESDKGPIRSLTTRRSRAGLRASRGEMRARKR